MTAVTFKTSNLIGNTRFAVTVSRLGMAGVAAVAVTTMGFTLFTTSRAESHSTQQERPIGALTAREVEIVRLLAEGKVNKEIAAMLGISCPDGGDAPRQNHAQAWSAFACRTHSLCDS